MRAVVPCYSIAYHPTYTARTGSVLVVDHLRKVGAAEGWMQELVDLHKKQLVSCKPESA